VQILIFRIVVIVRTLIETIEAQQLFLLAVGAARHLQAHSLIWHQSPILQGKGDISGLDFGITELHRLFPPEHVFH
jgi:hypothetical protein